MCPIYYLRTSESKTNAELVTSKFTSYFGAKAAQVVAQVLQSLFKLLDQVMELFHKNWLYADLFFAQVNKGKYVTAKLIDPGTMNMVSTTRLIELQRGKDRLSATESAQVIRNVGALVGLLLRQDDTATLSRDQAITTAMDLWRNVYQRGGGKWAALSRAFDTTQLNDDFEEEPNPEYGLITKDVLEYVKCLAVLDNLSTEEAEDEVGANPDAKGWEKEAWEVGGFPALPGKIKQYISLVGIPRKLNGNPVQHSVTVPGYVDPTTKEVVNQVKLPVIDIVDPGKVYYGVARALANTRELGTRLEKLLTYTQFEGTTATSAFTEQLLRDMAPVIHIPTELLPTILTQFKIRSAPIDGKQLKAALLQADPGLTQGQLAGLVQQAFTRRQETSPYIIKEQLLYALHSNTLNDYLSTTGKALVTSILKGFDLWTREMQVLRIDTATGASIASNANINRADKNLLNTWHDNYKKLSIKGIKPERVDLDALIIYAGAPFFKALTYDEQVGVLDTQLAQESKRIRQEFAKLGIDLVDGYVQYSLLENTRKIFPNLNWVPTKAGQLARVFKIKKDQLLSRGDLDTFNNYLASPIVNPFVSIKNGTKLMQGWSRIRKEVPQGNAFFDETAFDSNYLSSEKETIFAYQNKTYSLEFQDWFTDPALSHLAHLHKSGQRQLLRKEGEAGIPNYLKEDSWTLTKNVLLDKLLNDPFYIKHREKIRGFAAEGIQQASLLRDGDYTTANPDGLIKDGLTFGSMTAREFDLFNLNTAAPLAHLAYIDPVTKQRIAPVFLGNRETSRTGEYMMLPVLPGLIKNGALTTAGQNLLLDEVEKEFNRIKRVYQDLKVNPETGQTDTSGIDNLCEKYHTGGKLLKLSDDKAIDPSIIHVPTKGADYRGLQFTDGMQGFLGELTTLPTSYDPNNLIIKALEGKPFDRDSLRDLLSSQVRATLDGHFTRLAEEGIWDSKLNKGTTLLDNQLTKAHLEEKILSDTLNGMYLGQLAYGDAALLFKNDGTDIFKRLKSLNAAIVSFANPLTNPELGITKPNDYLVVVTTAEPKSRSDISGDSIDHADAQGWQSVQALRRGLFGMGLLDARQASLLDSIQEGKVLSLEQIKAQRESEIMYNSLKTVGADGQQYKKLSVTLLSKELTSLSSPVSEGFYKGWTTHDPYGRTRLKLGAPELSAYRDDTGVMQYRLWRARQDTQGLHDRRLLMEGFQFQADSEGIAGGQWVYRGAEHELDLITPLTASKTLNMNVHQTMVSPSEVDFKTVQDKSRHLLDMNFYGKQTENPSGKQSITDPTQMLELILGEMGDIEVLHKGKFIRKTSITQLWQDYSVARDNVNYNLADNLFTDEQGQFTTRGFREKIFEAVLKIGSDKQTTALLNPDSGYNPNLPLTRDTFISQFFSHFSKEVLSHKRAGDSLAPVSSDGHFGVKRVFKREVAPGRFMLDWEYIRKDSGRYLAVIDKPLPNLSDYRYKHEFTTDSQGVKTRIEPQFYKILDKKGHDKSEVETSWFAQATTLLGTEEEVYVLDTLRVNKPRWEQVADQKGKLDWKETGFFSETLMPTHDDKIIRITSDLAYSFAVRIPSQDKHSAVNAQWVDTLPVFMGSSVVVPKEIVELSGCDFDIDKLYLSRPEGYWEGNRFIPYGKSNLPQTQFAEFQRYIQAHYKGIKTEAHFRKNNLPATLAEWTALPVEQRELLNVGAINNNMLNLQQGMLANGTTLDDADPLGGQYNQPASLDKLQHDSIKDLHHNGAKLFGQTNPTISTHWPMSHSRCHENSQAGKALIGVGVNGNLFLVNAIRYGFQVHEDCRIQYLDGRSRNGSYTNLIKMPDGTTVRVADILSTIITANTDEAKEALNAFYGMNSDGQSAVIQLVGQGYELVDALVFVNQAVVRKYIALSANVKKVQAGQGIFSPDEQKRYGKMGEEDKVIEVLGMGMTEAEDKRSGYSPTELRDELALVKNGYRHDGKSKRPNGAIQAGVLLDFINIMQVGAYADHFVRVIKLRNGFGQQTEDFDRVQESIQTLSEGLYSETAPPINIMEQLQAKPEKAAWILNLINSGGLIDRNRNRQDQLFLWRSPVFTRLFTQLTRKKLGFKTDKAKIPILKNAVETFILTKLFNKLFQPVYDPATKTYLPGPMAGETGLDLTSVFTDGGEAQTAWKFQQFQQTFGSSLLNVVTKTVDKGIFADNQLFTLLSPTTKKDGVSALTLNTIAKLRPDQQEGLLDSFRELFTKPNQPLVNGKPVGYHMGFDLIKYYIVKDGWQFTMGTLSRLFPPDVFGAISQAVTEFQTTELDKDTLLQWGAELKTSLGRDVNYAEFIHPVRSPAKSNLVTMDKAQNSLWVDTDRIKLSDLETEVEDGGFGYSRSGIHFAPFVSYLYKDGEDEDYLIQFELVGVNGKPVQGGNRGWSAQYARVVGSGAKGVSAATGLGQHYSEPQRSQLNKRLAQVAGNPLLTKYFQDRLSGAVTQGATTVLCSRPVFEDYQDFGDEPPDFDTSGLFNNPSENQINENSCYNSRY